MTSLENNSTDDGLTQTNTQHITNLTLMDNRDTLEETTRESLVMKANSSIHQLNEQQWSLLQMCARPMMISSFKWDSSTTSPLYTITLPDQAGQLTTYWKQLFKTFSFARFDMNIRVQINTTRFHSGRLALVWNPMSSFEPPTQGVNATIWSSTSLPHSTLDASMSNSAELVIPFQHYYSYIPLLFDDKKASSALGTLTIENLTGLQLVPPTSSEVQGKVWFWFSNIELYVPATTHKPFGDIEAQSGFVEQKLIMAEKLGQKATNLIGAGKETLKAGAQLFGLADSPSDPLPSNHVMLSNGPMAHGKGVSNSIRLALDPISGITTTDKDLGTSEDEMDLTKVISKSALVTVQDITTTPLDFSLPVNPMTVLNINTNVYPTFLAYVARKFAFWRGPLKYRFEFVCSNFHTGRFLVSFIPNISTFTGDVETLASCPSTVIDLQEKRSFEFVVPYVSQQPYKAISDFTLINDTINLRFSTGILKIKTMNNIAFPGNVSPFCQLWIYVSAPTGFELAVPNNVINDTTLNVLFNDDSVFRSQMEVEAQSSYLAVENNNLQQEEEVVLGNTQKIALADKSLYGESFMHLSNYLARNSCAFRFDFTQTFQWFFQIPITAEMKILTNQGQNSFTRDNLTWFSKLYTFWRGSIRVASLNNFGRTVNGQIITVTEPLTTLTADASAIDYVDNTSNLFDALSGNAFTYNNSTMSPVVEVETPYYTQFQNMLVRSPVDGFKRFYPDFQDAKIAGSLNIIYDIGKPQDDRNLRLAGLITRSAAPDFHFSYIGRPPILSR